MSAQGAALVLEKAGFSYAGAEGEPPALRDLSFEVPRGQCLVLTGASGCGKTTLTRLMNGLIPLAFEGRQSGRVLVEGRSPQDWGPGAMAKRVASVFQNPRSQCFNLDTTSELAFCCENLGFPAPEVRRRVKASARDLGLEQLLDRDMRALSGGQRQLVAIASVYAAGPDVFVLDEPTASLDAASMRLLVRLVKRLKQLGKTLVVSEHRLWWLAEAADRVVYLQEGRVAHDWTAQQLASLSDERRRSLGLRARDQAELVRGPEAAAGAAAPSLEGPECCALQAGGLRAGYGRRPEVLRGVDARLIVGRAAALVGPNGAGKTTFARCLAGLHRERGGEVLLDGARAACRRRAGRVYLAMQEPGYQLFSDSVRGEIEEALEGRAGRRAGPAASGSSAAEEAEGLLSRFGLSGLEGRHPLSLSGGQRRRLAIAAGCAQGARVLVLDEPTSGLDYASMQRVARELAALRDAGRAVLVITHDYEFLAEACDSALELKDGRARAAFQLDDVGRARVLELFGFGPLLEGRRPARPSGKRQERF